MPQATAPATTPEIDVRWEMANYGRPTRYLDDGGIVLSLTKRHERVSHALEDIAAMLVADGVWREEYQDDEKDNVEALIGETWTEIERRFKAWAARAPERRARIREGWAAEKAAKAAVPA